MKLILNSDVKSLGRKGDVVDVAKGYARNYLLPKKLAVVANSSNLKFAEALREKREIQAVANNELAESIKTALADAKIVISQNTTDEGTLYAAVSNEQIVDAIKISSSDNNFFPLLKTVFSGDKPVIISTGLSNNKEIEDTLNYILSKCKNTNFKNELALLHCVTAYPVEHKYANLKSIKTIKDNFNVTVGYSDHTLGINAAIASVALGARLIEKHFTKDKSTLQISRYLYWRPRFFFKQNF